MTKKKILVACGTAVATATVVARKMEELLKQRGYDVIIDQCKAAEAHTKLKNVDLIVTTTPVFNVGEIPVVQTLSFLTGVGIEADIDKIISLLKGAEDD